MKQHKEIEERKLNLLVFGQPETAPEASELERAGNDILQMKDVFTELKIDVEVSNVMGLGRQMDGHNHKIGNCRVKGLF